MPSGYLGVFALVPSGHRARAQSLNAAFSQRPSESRKVEITNLIEFENIWVHSSTRSFTSPSDPKKKNSGERFQTMRCPWSNSLLACGPGWKANWCSNDKNLYQTKSKRSIKTIVFTRRYLILEKINHFTETRKWTNRLFSRFFWKSSWHLSSCISYTLTIILSSQLVFACSEIFGLFFSQ